MALTMPIKHHAGQTHQRSGGQSLKHVIQQSLHATGKNFFLALFRMIALHHAYAAKRLGESASDFSVDLRPRTKNRTDGGEGFVDEQAKGDQDQKG